MKEKVKDLSEHDYKTANILCLDNWLRKGLEYFQKELMESPEDINKTDELIIGSIETIINYLIPKAIRELEKEKVESWKRKK